MSWMINYYVYYTTNTRGAGIIHHLMSMIQGSRPGATGGIPGRAPPKWLLVPPKQKLRPPKRGLCPEEINRLGATWVQIEAQIGVLCGPTPDIRTFLGWRPFFFFLEITHFRPEKPFEFLISVGKSFANLEKIFSLEITCLRPENPLQIWRRTLFCFWRLPVKTAWISDFGRKIPLNLCFSPCSSDPEWDKFLVPPHNLLLIPQSRYPGAGPAG